MLIHDLQTAPLPFYVRGMRFDAITCGPEDGELVLFLHGFPEFADAWVDIIAAVSRAGFRAVAFDQRGYSPGARPLGVDSYRTSELIDDALAVADALGAQRFHLVSHDWGGIVAWKLAVAHRERLLSLTVLSTPHVDALLDARRTDPDQRRKSRYISLFRMPFHIAERLLLRKNAAALRRAYRGKLPSERLETYVRRLEVPGALTAGLNWYRAFDLHAITGPVQVPTLFIWGSEDQALGRRAAEATKDFVLSDYRFLPLQGASHWLLEEAADRVSEALVPHLRRWRCGSP